MNEIPEWFWQLIDESKPDINKLIQRLEKLDKCQLQDYFGYYKRASQELCDPWDGPFINEEIGHLSEDSTEDLCDWIVSQGYDYWSSIDIDDEAMAEVFHKRYAVRNGKDKSLVNWSETKSKKYNGYSDPKWVALAVHELRFNEDLLDYLDDIMDRVSE